MPKRLTTELARERFLRFGFLPDDTFVYRNNKQKYRVLDEVTNKYVSMSMNYLTTRVKKNRRVEVDPFLGALHDTGFLDAPEGSIRERKLERYTDKFPIEEFKREPHHLRERVMDYAMTLKRLAGKRKTTTIVRVDDVEQDKVSLYAMIDTLFAVSHMIFKRYRIALKIESDIDKSHYWYIGETSISRLRNMIQVLFYGAQQLAFTESNEYTLANMSTWQRISIIFTRLDEKEKDLNELDVPAMYRQRRGGNLWKYINETDIDLSQYGIFNKYDPAQTEYACFVQALEHSGMLTASEVDYAKSIVNTRTFPTDHINKLCKALKISIDLAIYDERKKRITTHDWYGRARGQASCAPENGQKSNERIIHLLLRDRHYMVNNTLPITRFYLNHKKEIDECPKIAADKRMSVRKFAKNGTSYEYHKNPKITINELIDICFKQGYFKKLTSKQLYETLTQKHEESYNDLRYEPSLCCRQKIMHNRPNKEEVVFVENIAGISGKVSSYRNTIMQVKTDDKIYRNIKMMLPFPNPTQDELSHLASVIDKRYGVDLYQFRSLAALGNALMHKFNVFDNVFELSGKPAAFIELCAPKIVVGPAFGSRIDKYGLFIQLDKNSAYPTTYMQFEGIPKGAPKVMTDLTEIDKYSYYYVLINVKSYKCKHEDRFPLIAATGRHHMAKTVFELLLQHYDVDYEFISGYYFDEGFNKNIARLAQDLIDLRKEFGNNRLSKCIKHIANSLWGKCKPRKTATTKFRVTKDKWDKYEAANRSFIYGIVQDDDETRTYELLNPLSINYSVPQFSTNVLAHARGVLGRIYYKAADMNKPIYYTNTDSILIDAESYRDLQANVLAEGEWKVEYDGITHIKIISAKRYYYAGVDGIIKQVGRVW